MSQIRSQSANGPRGSLRSAPGGPRPPIGDRKSLATAGSQLPSLGISAAPRGSRPPLGGSASQKGGLSSNGRTRLGNPDAKDDKATAVITIDDVSRLREQVGLVGAKTEFETEQEQRTRDRLELQERSRQRVKNWPNTIDNLRNKRIEDKYRKLEEAE